MKRILLTLVAALNVVVMCVAQTSFVATLSHNDTFTHYYGANALTSAYKAAVDGDIINLSSGTFTASSLIIDKGITLRGTGFETTNTTYEAAFPNLTFISGDIKFRSTDSTRVTTVEGIRFKSKVSIETFSSDKGQGTIKFIKNFIANVNATYWTIDTKDSPKVRFYNNAINGMYFNGYTKPDFLFYNCYIENPYSSSANFAENSSAFINCVIKYNNQNKNYYCSWAHYLNFYNCIIYCENRNDRFPSTVTCQNCLSVNWGGLYDYLVSGGNNKNNDTITDVFKTYSGTHNWHETFELTDAAKTTYLGTDGTQVGMQGGNYPYSTTVQYPVITKFKSAPQTTKEGILSINVEVDGQ